MQRSDRTGQRLLLSDARQNALLFALLDTFTCHDHAVITFFYSSRDEIDLYRSMHVDAACVWVCRFDSSLSNEKIHTHHAVIKRAASDKQTLLPHERSQTKTARERGI